MTPAELRALATQAQAADLRRVTLSVPPGWLRPPGFPRCDLLSVNPAGWRNLSVAVPRLLAWVDARFPAPSVVTPSSPLP